MAMYKTCPGLLKFYVPALVLPVVTCILLIEGRIAYAFATEDF